MTTIRDEMKGVVGWQNRLRILGIDPDLPAEWATVDRCLTWLRARQRWLEDIDVDEGASGTEAMSYSVAISDPEADVEWEWGLTLHAALIAACKAVQEDTP